MSTDAPLVAGPFMLDDRAPDEDERLLCAFRERGDREAMARLHQRHADRAWRLARRMTGDPTDAEDVVQSAFMDAMRAAGTYRTGRDVGAWLLGIVANRARMALREARRRRSREAAAAPATVVEPAAGDDSHDVIAQLDRLPEPMRLAVWLRYHEGLTVGAIAAGIGTPERTVRSHISAGISRLRQALSRDGGAASVAALEASIRHVPTEPVPGPLLDAISRLAHGPVIPATAPVGVLAVWTVAGLLAAAILAVALASRPAAPPEPSAAQVAPPATDPPPAADPLERVLQRTIALERSHVTLGVLLHQINESLPAGTELPYACVPGLLQTSWSGVTTSREATIRESLDAAAAAYGARWRVMSGVVVFSRALDADVRERMVAAVGDAGGTRQQRDDAVDALAKAADVEAVRALLLALSRPEVDRDRIASVLTRLDGQATPLSAPADKGLRPLLSAFRDDDEVCRAVRLGLAEPKISFLPAVAGALRLRGVTALLVGRLRAGRVPETLHLGPGVVFRRDVDGIDGIPAALAAIGEAEAETAMLDLLREAGPRRALAARALGLMGSRAAEPMLLGMLGPDSEPMVVDEAAEALGRIGSAAAAPRLIGLADAGGDAARGAVVGLGLLRSVEGIPAMWRCLRATEAGGAEASWQIRLDAADALARCPAEAVIAAMPSADGFMADPTAVCAVLGRLASPAGVPFLLGQLSSPTAATRRAAADALGGIRDDALVTTLAARLELAVDETSTEPIAIALGRSADPRAIGVLQQALASRGGGPGSSAIAFALGMTRLAEPLATLSAMVRSTAPERRACAAKALAGGRTPAGRQALLGLLTDPDPGVRLAVITGLVGHEDARLAWDAMYAGGVGSVYGTCDDAAGAALLKLIDADPDPGVRAGCLSLVRALDPAARMAVLLRCLKASAPGTRLAATKSLGGTENAAELLKDSNHALLEAVAHDADAAVRIGAARALMFPALMTPQVRDDLRAAAAAEADPAVKQAISAVVDAAVSGRTVSMGENGPEIEPAPARLFDEPPEAVGTPGKRDL